MTLRIRHAMLLALVACGPADGDETSGSSTTGGDSMSSNPSDPSASSFPPDPTVTTLAPTTTPPTTEPPTTVTPTTDPPPDPTTTSPTTPTTVSPTVSTVTTEVFTDPSSFTDSSDTDFTTFDPSTESVFIIEPDQQPAECDVFAEDCPAGLKCMPFADDPDGTWNNLRCTPIDPNPRAPGESCFVEGNGVSGIDNCQMHALCFDVNDNLEGTCVAMCTGSQSDPVCPQGQACLISNGGVLPLCLNTCDPLNILSCEPGDVCVASGDSFLCVFDGSDDGGQLFDECAFTNSCDPGLLCVTADGVPACDPQADGCCTAYCNLTLPNLCPPPLPCVPFFGQGQAPPGHEDVGVCFQQ